MKNNFQIPETYQFKKYDSPKIGLFSVLSISNEYRLDMGWVCENKEITIIGETKDSFITKLSKSENGYWIGGKVVKEKITIPHGIHKSRFISWTYGQMNLEF